MGCIRHRESAITWLRSVLKESIGKVDHVLGDHARIWGHLRLFTERPPPKGTSENVVPLFRGPPAEGHSPAFPQKINDIQWGKETPWITVVGPLRTEADVAIIAPAIFVNDLSKN